MYCPRQTGKSEREIRARSHVVAKKNSKRDLLVSVDSAETR
jgi:hypothetical protein